MITIDLTPEELQRILLILKQDVKRRRVEGDDPLQEEALIARLEIAAREQRGKA